MNLKNLVVSLVYIYAFASTSPAFSKDITEAKMNYSNARFHYQRTHKQVAIVWANPNQISTTLQLELFGIQSIYKNNWTVTNVDSQQMQKLLRDIDNHYFQTNSEYNLVIERSGESPIQLSWNLANETQQLGQIRNYLENTSHIHYAESVAALNIGHSLLKRSSEKDAINAFQSGISALDRRYISSGLIDDTNTKLIFAESLLRTNKLTQSAALFERVLESRIHAYEHLYKLSSNARGIPQ